MVPDEEIEIVDLDDEVVKLPLKKRIIKFIRNLFIGVSVLSIIAISAGFAYTWYMGQNSVVVDDGVIETVNTAAPLIQPSKPAADAKVSASVQALTSPVKPGANVMMIVKTNAGANCKIKAVYDEVESIDSGLYDKTADEYGVVSWSWTVGLDAPIGRWPVTVTCANEVNSGVTIGYLVVE